MKTAIIGLMQSGKSTLFAALSGKKITPSGSMHIEEAIVPVPDDRLDFLTELYNPKKTTQATIDCLDIPGFSFLDDHARQAARRLINKIRTNELLVFVVRAFENSSVPPYRKSVDPRRDLNELKTELLLADLELVTTRIDKLQKQIKRPTKTQAKDKAELELQLKLQETIEAEKPLSTVIQTEEQLEMVKSLGLLTLKPFVIAVNIGEENLKQTFDFSDICPDIPLITISAELEHELAQLDAQSKKEFMADLGIKEPATVKFARTCYSALGLISFLTIGSDEVRAWPIKKGTSALDAAGKVHTDIKRGFIRAETITYEDLKILGSEKDVKAAGKARLEGKQYIVNDGDIINFRFNI